MPWRDHVKDLNKRFKEFIDANCQIVLVSFGEEKGARRWLNENFPDPNTFKLELIVDTSRTLYRLFGVRRSFHKVWSSECLTYYAEQVTLGRDLPKAYKDIDDDPHQMGGNFIVEFDPSTNQFRAVYVYKSKTPNDRPTSEQLLKFLNGQN